MDAHAASTCHGAELRFARRGSAGHNLPELLVTLAMVSLLLAATYPGLDAPGKRSEPRRFTLAVTQALMTARSAAIASGRRTTFCGSRDGESCDREWPAEVQLLVFEDWDGNRQVDIGDTVHLKQALALDHGRALARLSAGRPYLRYRGDGSALDFGRFTYCPADGDETSFRQLVVNRVGRVYQHHDGEGRLDHCDGLEGW